MIDTPKFIDHELLAKIEGFIASRGISSTDFGLKSVNDRRLIPDLRAGRELRRATRERILSYISDPEAIEQQARAS